MKKERILFTGSTGFIGRNIYPYIKEKFIDQYEILTPNRQEINFFSSGEVSAYLKQNDISIVLHCANPNPVKNEQDHQVSMLEGSLRIFMNLYASRHLFEKMIYMGSGAEYNKNNSICSVTEEKCFLSIPDDEYGFAKYTMNCLTDKSKNIYNLCVFGCYGPSDHCTKFITHCIRSNLAGVPITIRQDCYFDYLHVYDLAHMVGWMFENTPQYHMYNATSGTRTKLSDIARIVNDKMGADKPIQILKSGLANEYTACNQRFVNETGIRPLISIEDGIDMQIQWEKDNWHINKNHTDIV